MAQSQGAGRTQTKAQIRLLGGSSQPGLNFGINQTTGQGSSGSGHNDMTFFDNKMFSNNKSKSQSTRQGANNQQKIA
jgi:hypothetical protein